MFKEKKKIDVKLKIIIGDNVVKFNRYKSNIGNILKRCPISEYDVLNKFIKKLFSSKYISPFSLINSKLIKYLLSIKLSVQEICLI